MSETLKGFSLSPQQERLWRLRVGGRLPSERAVALVEVLGPLDPGALRRALETLVARHEILRTSFRRLPGMSLPLQVPETRGRVELRLHTGSDDPAVGQERLFSVLCRESDPESPLVRATLIALEPLRHALLLDLSPLCIDRAGFVSLIHDLEQRYGTIPKTAEKPVPQYADISANLWELLDSDTEAGRGDRAQRRVKQALAGFIPLALPLGTPEASREPAVVQSTGFVLEGGLLAQIDGVAATHGASAHSFLLAAWQVLLGSLGGAWRFPLAVSCDGRSFDGLGEVPGLLARYLPLSSDLRLGGRFADLLRRVEATLGEVVGWQDCFALQPAVEEVLSRFGFHFLDARWKRSNPKLLFELRRIGIQLEPLDLELVCTRLDQKIEVELHYAQAIFSRFEIERLAGWLENLLRSAAAAPMAALEDLALLERPEALRLQVELNDTRLDLPGDLTLQQLFLRQAAATADRIAAVFDDLQLTYSGLAERVCHLAARLRRRGVGPEVRVGICAQRSLDLVVGMLAVLEAGGAYVPLDPSHPRERLAFLVEDSQPLLLLAEERRLSDLAGLGVDCISLEVPEADNERQERRDASGNLAYLIHTSGSTGRPKGVLVEHRAILNRLLWMQRKLPVKDLDCFLLKTPFGFDASIWEVFLPLITGARLVVARPEGHREPAYLRHLIAEQGITLFQLVPSLLRVWLHEPDLAASSASLRAVFCGGEALAQDQVSRFHDLLPRTSLWNLYGPTECAIDVAAWLCPREGEGAIPVGRPIANTRIHLLDAWLRPLPAGVPGELYVAGTGLARGYHGRPDLTAERFIPDPFAPRDEPGGRLYRTGDMARHRPDGALELLGRIDQQVKIRGVRIEPGEIEAVLASDPAVGQAVVVPRPGPAGEAVLIAYVVPREPQGSGWLTALRARLESHLPAAMVPARVVVLPDLPRLPGGKVDRQALPDPEATARRAPPEGPRKLGQELMSSIWADVLGIEDVGIHDNFFELGGHSLLATQLASRLRRAFQVEITVRALFDAPSVAALAEQVEALRQRGAAVTVPPLRRVDRGESIPTSFAQQRLWFLNQLDPGSPAYNIALTVRLTGGLDRAALAASFEELVLRHEMLRTVFPDREGSPVQHILSPGGFVVSLLDLMGLAPERRESQAATLVRQEARRPFDLARGPLLRALLVRIDSDRHLLLILMHHIISDGWSTAVLLHEISHLYEAAIERRPSALPDLPLQYADFSCWQRQWLQGEVLEAQLAWWRERLQGESPIVQLPTDRPRPAVWSGRGTRLPIVLAGALSNRLRVLARRRGTTLFMLLLAAFKALLHRTSGQSDITVGTPIANRTRIEIEGLIGFFVNTLVLRSAIRPGEAFTDLLTRVREVCLSASEYQDLPFEKLVEELRPGRSPSQTPLFNILFVLQNVELTSAQLPGLFMEPWPTENGTAKFDLTLDLRETPDGLTGVVELNTDLFDSSSISRMMGHFENLLESVAADSLQSLSSLSLLSPAELHQLIEWNDSAAEISGIRLDRLFARQAERTPDAVAVRFDSGCMTYHELDRRATGLARRLIAAGLEPESRVGLLAERSPEMLMGLLAILKAGGAFLPLDPRLTEERLAYQVKDSDASALLSSASLLQQQAALHPRTFLLDGGGEPSCAGDIGPGSSDSLAYVMYTSGSTGFPKGVMVSHRGLVNYLLWAVEAYGLRRGGGAPLLSPIGFDLTLTSLFAPLIAGGSVSLLPEDLGPDALGRTLEAGRFDLVKVTPAHLELLREEGLADVLVVGGEALHGEDLRPWRARVPGSRVFNEYGPTETVVGCCVHEVPAGEPPAGPIAIGRPIANVSLHLLDFGGLPVPLGAPGELYIGGKGVARGYWNRPDLTAERFIPDPFSSGPDQAGARLYKSGDLARRMPDGRLVFLGRIDHQVKVRGVRVELGEVEAVLLQHPQVREAAVVAQGDSSASRRLIAYVVAEEELESAELRAFLRKKLPEPFVPSAVVTLPAMPLTPNGKLDRAALSLVSPEQERRMVAPRNDIEAVLAGIWSQVLGLERVGVRDDFFELGGHSLLATQVLSRIRNTFRTELPLRGFYGGVTVESLAEALVAAEPKPGLTERVARLLRSVSQLDDVEAKRLLEQKRQARPTN